MSRLYVRIKCSHAVSESIRNGDISLLLFKLATIFLSLEKTNVFHNVFKVWMKYGNIMEKLWKSSSTIFPLFHDMELKLNAELVL